MEKRSKVRSDIHEMVLLSHLQIELNYIGYGDLELRNLDPLREEVKDRISALANKDKQTGP